MAPAGVFVSSIRFQVRAIDVFEERAVTRANPVTATDGSTRPTNISSL